jgi:ubiquinone/menaquinone biosynthesis C-methylase UbiE
MGDAGTEKKQSYANIFDDMNRDWKAIVDTHDTPKEATFVRDVLLNKGPVLDLCCGTGRHSVILNQEGLGTVGMDLSKNLLAIAKQEMRNAGVYFPLVRADMRCFPFKDEVFEAVICMFTSFGYLPSEADDIRSFLEVRRTLRRNGRFLLDVANIDHIIGVFREKEWAEFEPFYMTEKRSLDLQTSRLISRWTITPKNTSETRRFQHIVRLYTLKSVKKMLEKTGLAVKEVYGGYDVKGINSESTRMIVLSESNPNI